MGMRTNNPSINFPICEEKNLTEKFSPISQINRFQMDLFQFDHPRCIQIFIIYMILLGDIDPKTI